MPDAPDWRTLVAVWLPTLSIASAPNASSRWSYPNEQRRLLTIWHSSPPAPRSTTMAESMSPASAI